MTNLELIQRALELEIEDLKDSLKLETDSTRIESLESQQSLCQMCAVSTASMNFLDDAKATAISEMCFNISLAELRELII